MARILGTDQRPSSRSVCRDPSVALAQAARSTYQLCLLASGSEAVLQCIQGCGPALGRPARGVWRQGARRSARWKVKLS